MGYLPPHKLEVYKKAFSAASELHRLSLDFPKIEQYGGIADQIRRSSKSICANIAEGLGKQMSDADKRKFLSIAMGSAVETQTWLQFACEFGYIDTSLFDRYFETYREIGAMLHGLTGTLTASS